MNNLNSGGSSTGGGGMDGPFCLERESALGGLFQQIINEMKNTAPYWDDFLTKSNKLHSCLRATILAVSAFLEAFQKIADAATSTRGATKEIGTALTRICLRHKAMEAKLKSFTSSIMDCLIIPLQKRLEEWNKATGNMNKEYGKEYKRARAELKKRTIETIHLQKKLRKGGLHNGGLASSFHGTLPRSHGGGGGMIQSALAHNGSDFGSHHGLPSGSLNRTLESAMKEQAEKRQIFEEVGKNALRAALTEERSRFCLFVSYLKPVVEEEVAMLFELQHVQEAMAQLEKNSADPYILPPASEQVIADTKGDAGAWSFQTPPSSPSSLGSRKSSMCSISSANSSSGSSAHSPSHHLHNRTLHHQPLSIPSGGARLSSVSSHDSGFVSQDTLYSRMSTPLNGPKASNQSEGSNTSSTASSNSSTPSSPYPPGQIPTTNSTWPNLQETQQFERAACAIMNDRPHTISSAYEKGHQRPPLTVYTFQPPQDPNSPNITPTVESHPPPSSQASTGNKIYQAASEIYGILRGKGSSGSDAKPPVPKRGSSLERPGSSHGGSTSSIPKPPRKVNASKESHQVDSNKPMPFVPDFNQSSDDMIVPQPVYVNMHELNQMASAKRQSEELPPPPPELMGPQGKAADPNDVPTSNADSVVNSNGPRSSTPGYPGDSHSIIHNDHTAEGYQPSITTGMNNGTLSRRNSCGQQEKPAPPRRNSSISSSARSSPVPSNPYNNQAQSQQSVNNSEYQSQSMQRTTNGSNSSHPVQPIFIKNPQYNNYVSSNSSNSNTNSVGSSQGSYDSGETTPHASMESLPPPPAYLINEQDKLAMLNAAADDLQKRLSVAETVRTLTEKKHQPKSPQMVRRTNSLKQPGEETRETARAQQSNGRRSSASSISSLETSKQRANLMQVLNQKLAQHQTPYGSHGHHAAPPQQPQHHMHPQQVPQQTKQQYIHPQPISQQQKQQPQHHMHPQPVPQQPSQTIYHQNAPAHHQQQPIYSQVYQPQPIYQQVVGNGSPANNASPRHNNAPRRFSEELLKTTATFVHNRVLGSKTPPPAVTSKEIFVQTLNAKLSQMRQSPVEKKIPATMHHSQGYGHHQNIQNNGNGRPASFTSKITSSKGNSVGEISRAFRVRQWISSKTVSDPTVCRDSLMDQIRRGTKLRTTRSMNDRSAPRIH